MRDKTTFYEESGRPRPRLRFDSLFTIDGAEGHTTKSERMTGQYLHFWYTQYRS